MSSILAVRCFGSDRRCSARLKAIGLLLATGVAALPQLAHAQVAISFSGSNTGQPTFNRPWGGYPPAVLYGGTFNYAVLPYQTIGSGSMDLTYSASSYDSYAHVYGTSFDPSAPLGNVLAGDDDSAGYPNPRIIMSFAEGTNYFNVTSSYTPLVQGAFTVNFTSADVDGLIINGTAGGFTGPTVINTGTLLVNGSLANSAVTVNSGTLLGGTGTVGATTIATGGTLAPGAGIGTLAVNGNLTFNVGSTYAVEVSPAQADRTNVLGVATLTGATVAATYAAGTYVTQNYTILNATGGLGGTTFAGLTGALLPGLESSLVYDANNVYLSTVVAQTVEFNGLNENQRAVATSLLTFFDASGALPAEFANLDSQGLTLVSGEVASAAASAGLYSSQLFLSQISDPFVTRAGTPLPASYGMSMPMGYAAAAGAEPSNVALAALGEETPSAAEAANGKLAMAGVHSADPVGGYTAASPWTIWGTAYGGAQDIDGDAGVGSADLSARNWGLATGFDYAIDGGKIGFALGGAGSSFSLAGGLGSGDATIFNAGVYGAKTFGNAYVSAAAAYAFNSVDTSRAVFGDTLDADYDAHTLSGRIEGGYRFDTSLAALIPYAAVQGSSYFMPAYDETSATGGPFALSYAKNTQSDLRTELGIRLEHLVATGSGDIKLSGRLAWAWNADRARDVTAAFQSLAAPSFTINGAEPDEHALLVDAGAEFALSANTSAKLSFAGEFSGNLAAYGGAAKLSYKW